MARLRVFQFDTQVEAQSFLEGIETADNECDDPLATEGVPPDGRATRFYAYVVNCCDTTDEPEWYDEMSEQTFSQQFLAHYPHAVKFENRWS